jgi:NAD(P)-dependent dehydrogenase (short-subunit alcohol dehydrogenase family)
MTPEANDVWLITGATSGLGAALAEQVLRQGHRAVLTARDVRALEPLAHAHAGRCLALPLDLQQTAAIAPALEQALARFGRLDVLVNNAGRGYMTAIEHARDADIRGIFELNFFAMDHLTRAALPGLRGRRRGHIVNISSTGGLVGRAGSGFYAATKFAMEGYSEALAQELAPHGVGVTVVEPGAFRTRFADALLQGSVEHYEETAGARLQAVLRNTGRQPGDPARGARLIYEAVTDTAPPLHLPLGAATVGVFRDKAQAVLRDFSLWEARAAATEQPAEERQQGDKP